MEQLSPALVVRRYILIFGVPISAISLAGLAEPFLEGAFFPVATAVAICTAVVLLFHEEIFSEKLGAPDPLPENALAGYLGLAFCSFAFAVVALSFDSTAVLYSGVSPEPDFSLATVTAFKALGALTWPTLIWLAVLPPIGVVFFYYLRTRRRLARSLAVAPAIVMFGSLCLLATKNQRGSILISLSIQELTIIQLVVLFFSGLITVSVFFVVLRISEDVLRKLNSDGNIWLLLPIGLTVGDLVAIVQGFSGLHEHYSFMASIAFGGMLALILSLVAGILFGGVCLSRGLTSRNISHYLMAFALSVFQGSLTLYVLAEAGGFWLKVIRGIK